MERIARNFTAAAALTALTGCSDSDVDFGSWAAANGLRLQNPAVASMTPDRFEQMVVAQASITQADYLYRLSKGRDRPSPVPGDLVAAGAGFTAVVAAARKPDGDGLLRIVVFDAGSVSTFEADVRGTILGWSMVVKGQDRHPFRSNEESNAEIGLREAFSGRADLDALRNGAFQKYVEAHRSTAGSDEVDALHGTIEGKASCAPLTPETGLCVTKITYPELGRYETHLELIAARGGLWGMHGSGSMVSPLAEEGRAAAMKTIRDYTNEVSARREGPSFSP